MKKLTRILFIVACLCLPIALQAQKKDDSRYLTGAVPEENGKVVFSKTFSIPGMSQDAVFDRILQWMDARLKKNENNSRVVYTKKEEGQIVGLGEEWIVFKSSALSLDRTKIIYTLTALCQPEECTLRIERIRFEYREGEDKEKYDAEEWISDKYALNKSKTKLVRGLAKWRRKTVDFTDTLFGEAANALSATTAQSNAKGNGNTEGNANTTGNTVITPKQEVTVQHDYHDRQRRRLIGQDVRKTCCIHHAITRPALRATGESRKLHRTFLSQRAERTQRHTGVQETSLTGTPRRTASHIYRRNCESTGQITGPYRYSVHAA